MRCGSSYPPAVSPKGSGAARLVSSLPDTFSWGWLVSCSVCCYNAASWGKGRRESQEGQGLARHWRRFFWACGKELQEELSWGAGGGGGGRRFKEGVLSFWAALGYLENVYKELSLFWNRSSCWTFLSMVTIFWDWLTRVNLRLPASEL